MKYMLIYVYDLTNIIYLSITFFMIPLRNLLLFPTHFPFLIHHYPVLALLLSLIIWLCWQRRFLYFQPRLDPDQDPKTLQRLDRLGRRKVPTLSTRQNGGIPLLTGPHLQGQLPERPQQQEKAPSS